MTQLVFIAALIVVMIAFAMNEFKNFWDEYIERLRFSSKESYGC